MSVQSDELLLAFARAAAKAQRIEAILKELLLAAEVAQDTRNRTFEQMAEMIEAETLGRLMRRFLTIAAETIQDPRFEQLWKEINDARIFLMHHFFNTFPVLTDISSHEEAGSRLKGIDLLLDRGGEIVRTVRDGTFESLNIPSQRLAEFLAFVVESRRNATTT